MTHNIMEKRILEEVHPLRIIREVEKWPVIYKKDSPEMINSHFRYKVWEEIAQNVFDNYESFSNTEKEVKVSNLMKKWRNLRDTFRRHLVVDKRNRAAAGHNVKKKKEYVYFKHMAYLLPHMSADDQPLTVVTTDRHSMAAQRRTARRAQQESSRRRERIAHESTYSTIEDIDEDKHFLLSLLPSFKRMNEDEKLTTKMEILKVIKDVKNARTLETLVARDTLALVEAQSTDEVLVKKELDTEDYNKTASESSSVDTE